MLRIDRTEMAQQAGQMLWESPLIPLRFKSPSCCSPRSSSTSVDLRRILVLALVPVLAL